MNWWSNRTYRSFSQFTRPSAVFTNIVPLCHACFLLLVNFAIYMTYSAYSSMACSISRPSIEHSTSNVSITLLPEVTIEAKKFGNLVQIFDIKCSVTPVKQFNTTIVSKQDTCRAVIVRTSFGQPDERSGDEFNWVRVSQRQKDHVFFSLCYELLSDLSY